MSFTGNKTGLEIEIRDGPLFLGHYSAIRGLKIIVQSWAAWQEILKEIQNMPPEDWKVDFSTLMGGEGYGGGEEGEEDNLKGLQEVVGS